MLELIQWPHEINHDLTPIKPLSQATALAIAGAVLSTFPAEAVGNREPAILMFTSPPCVHFSTAKREA